MASGTSEEIDRARRAGGADLAILHRELQALPAWRQVALSDLEPMRTKGLVHAHVRIRGRGAVLRIPRMGSFGLGPADNLFYQSECFRRARPSRHVPPFHAAILPREGIPWGALVIGEIEGATPSLPCDLGAIAEALAAIHAIGVPEGPARPPLPSHTDPVAATMSVIELQAGFLERAGLDPDALRQIGEELRWARGFAAEVEGSEQPISLAGTDTHPGNFLIEASGAAIFVDLEKMLYGAPAIDLAHASVYTSTMWDADAATALSPDDVSAFYESYFAAAGAAAEERIRPWCGPLRRLTWLRTTTWCAKWRVESRDGTAWDSSRHDPVYLESVRARIADYFDPATVTRIRAGFTDP